MKKKIKTIESIVKDVLETEPKTRNSDDLLYLKVCEAIKAGTGLLSMYIFLTRRKEYNLPSYGSVTRARRKLQAEHEELRALTEIEIFRQELEEEYREYARS